MRDATEALSYDEYAFIYSRVPRLTVEISLMRSNGAVFLTRRAIPPCRGRGLSHVPGGTVRYGETLLDAVRRIARRELGIDVGYARTNGYIEYPSHYLHGLSCPVGIVFEVTDYSGQVWTRPEADDGRWFDRLPTAMHPDQDAYPLERGYLAPPHASGSLLIVPAASSRRVVADQPATDAARRPGTEPKRPAAWSRAVKFRRARTTPPETFPV